MIHQQIEGMNRPLNYLMGRKGEAEFLSRLNTDQELEMQRSAFFAQLAHVIPTLMDLPIETVLAIRRKDRESFLDYRNTVRGIIAEHFESGGGHFGERGSPGISGYPTSEN